MENGYDVLPSARLHNEARKANPPENSFIPSPRRGARKVLKISRFDLARQILLSRNVKQAGFMAEIAGLFTPRDHRPVLFQEGEAHQKQRAAIAHLFAPSLVASRYRDLIKAQSERLLGRLMVEGRAQLDDLALELAVAVTAEIVGLNASDPPALTKRLSSFFAAKPPKQGAFAKFGNLIGIGYFMLRFFVKDVRPAIRARRIKRQEDLISQLLDQNYSARDILTETITYGAAGIATTRELIVMAAWHLFENEALRQRFVGASDKEQIAIVEEILRLEPVVGVLYRDVEKDIHLKKDGEMEVIPAGTRVAVDVRAVNTDAAVAGRCPFHIDPDRKRDLQGVSASIMSFGDGWHRCPGAPLALQETAVFLDCLFKIPGIRLEQAPTMDWNPLVESYELRGAFVTCAPTRP